MSVEDQTDDCAICALARNEDTRIAIDDLVAVCVPPWSRAEGAVCIVPIEHRARPRDADADTYERVVITAQRVAVAIGSSSDPDGLNTWWDTGAVAGQRHPHWFAEVVPRTEGIEYRWVPATEAPPVDAERRRDVAARLRGRL